MIVEKDIPFIEKLIKAIDTIDKDDIFHNKLKEANESNKKGDVGFLIERAIMRRFGAQNPDFDFNASSEPMLRFDSIKTDLKYKEERLQIKCKKYEDFVKKRYFTLIGEKNPNPTIEYFKSKTTLTLFVLYVLNNDNTFNYKYFFISKEKLVELFKIFKKKHH